MTIRFTFLSFVLLSLSACGAGDGSIVDDGPQASRGDKGDDASEMPVGKATVRPAQPAVGVRDNKPYGGSAHVIPGIIEAEHYDQGAPEVAYHDNDEQNQGVDYREETQVDIEKRDDASNGHGIGWTRTGEWVTYSVNIQEAGSYEIEIPVASNKQGGVFHLEIDGKDITGPIDVPDTGGWGQLKMVKAKTSPLEKGQFVMKMVMDSQGASGSIGDIDYLHFVPLP